jgi:lipopolysaccharide transport system ATP-binding protein
MGAISVSNLGKAYKQYPTRWSRLREWLSPSKKIYHQNKWVLRNISFCVQPGEAVGIIGINGAGKSTLLKLITGTTQPTVGSIYLTGRVAAMLELGMGFHPDFTGRQNAFMAGQILGITSKDITELMPEIEAFAEIGDYINQPVRIYSSGMQMRLAFSVATAIRPDILIVDEALSVGDAYFQHKSFDRIREFRKQGTTLLLVSHDKQAIQSICDRAILLNAGELTMQGEPEVVMNYYNAMLANQQMHEVRQHLLDDGRVQTVSGSGEVSLFEISLLNEKQESIEIVNVGESITLRVLVKCNEHIDELVLGYLIKDRFGQAIFGTNTHHHNQKIQNLLPGHLVEYLICFQANLGPGNYSLTIAAHSQDTHLSDNYEWRDQALIFHVINSNKNEFVGQSWLPPVIRVLM